MSGGGYRAAAFSLGTLAYLHHVNYNDRPLLHGVKFISSTSGGSITNLAYSAGLASGNSFEETYQHLLKTIEGEVLIAKVFLIFKNDAAWQARPDKSRNLINAFSMAYDELLYSNQYFELFNEGLKGTHLQEVCINATEFANGISFRFQSQHMLSHVGKGKVGNGYINFKDTNNGNVSGKIKLADILTCSSCFPGGFEPFIFPEDFSHGGLNTAELTDGINYNTNPFTTTNNPDDPYKNPEFKTNPKRFGLMDGGIADNQAIDGINEANNRRKSKGAPAFDLLIISDVTSYLIDGYSLPMETPGLFKHLTIAKVTAWLLGIGILFPVMIVLSLFIGWHHVMYLLLIPTGVALAVYLYSKAKFALARSKAKKDESTWLLMVFGYGAFFLNLRLSMVLQMLTARLKSVLLIVMDIYLKRIRAMYYKQLYSNPDTRNMVVANAIYDLSYINNFGERAASVPADMPDDGPQVGEESTGIVPPSPMLQAVAEKARLVATTLWFDRYQVRDQVKAAIVATGQFTVCYNLLKYLTKKEQRVNLSKAVLTAGEIAETAVPAETWTESMSSLKAVLEADWERFNADPFWLYNERNLLPAEMPRLKAVANKQTYDIISASPNI